MKIEDMNVEDLQKEIERRKSKDSLPKKPSKKSTVNTDALQLLVLNHIKDIEEKGYSDGDYKNDIYEAALIAFMGDDVIAWKKQFHDYHRDVRMAAK